MARRRLAGLVAGARRDRAGGASRQARRHTASGPACVGPEPRRDLGSRGGGGRGKPGGGEFEEGGRLDAVIAGLLFVAGRDTAERGQRPERATRRGPPAPGSPRAARRRQRWGPPAGPGNRRQRHPASSRTHNRDGLGGADGASATAGRRRPCVRPLQPLGRRGHGRCEEDGGQPRVPTRFVRKEAPSPGRRRTATAAREAVLDAYVEAGGLQPVRLPDHRDGWRWEPYAVDGADVEAARQQLQRLMRDAEADIEVVDTGAISEQGSGRHRRNDGGASRRSSWYPSRTTCTRPTSAEAG